MHDTRARLTELTGQHRIQGGQEAGRCVACGVTVWLRQTSSYKTGPQSWLQWHAPDGRDWSSFLKADGWETYPDGNAPACPPQGVEALCPWEENAHRYAWAWGDVQLETAMRTWCTRHQMAVSDCPEPGPPCPGAPAHEDGEEGRPGPCTGRENTCKCTCPPCCGDTPDMYGFDGDY